MIRILSFFILLILFVFRYNDTVIQLLMYRLLNANHQGFKTEKYSIVNQNSL